ncbi:MAG TPA: VOC family protein [Holophagaceae bacterium]|nr:VOC family protein [Holophagaceae bacterium]
MRPKPIPDGFTTVTPYLAVADGDRMLRFLEAAFGAEVLRRHRRPDGTLGNAEVQVGTARVMVGQVDDPARAMRAMLYLYVENVDAVFRAAVEAGGRVVLEPMDHFYGDRSGGLTDPCGNEWWIATHVEDLTDEAIERRARDR